MRAVSRGGVLSWQVAQGADAGAADDHQVVPLLDRVRAETASVSARSRPSRATRGRGSWWPSRNSWTGRSRPAGVGPLAPATPAACRTSSASSPTSCGSSRQRPPRCRHAPARPASPAACRCSESSTSRRASTRVRHELRDGGPLSGVPIRDRVAAAVVAEGGTGAGGGRRCAAYRRPADRASRVLLARVRREWRRRYGRAFR